MKHTLSFNGIYDLLAKVEKIRLAHELVNKLYRQTLLDNAIPFTDIGDSGVLIDISKVPKDKRQLIKNPFNEITEMAYKQTGVLTITNK